MIDFKKPIVIGMELILIGMIIFPICSGQEFENAPPVADAGGPYVGFEGSMVIFNASNSYDPENDPLEYIWDISTPGWIPSRIPIPDPLANYTWFDDFYGTATVYVFDDHDNSAENTTPVTIYNVDPVISSISGPIDPVQKSTEIQISANFYDVGINDTHTATVNWGDGSNSQGIVDEENGSGVATAAHTYIEPGVYTVNFTVTDDDGGFSWMELKYIVVYDPSSGFVTGGGWITSPVGSYLWDPTATGKATFGFISKYKKGQTTPSGNTEFQFHAGHLNFHSMCYEWLVITNFKAMYKGVGTINGEGSYGFLVSAIDADLTSAFDIDLFRIKIWDKTKDDVVVYDNNMGHDDDSDPTTQIGGGQIVIHKR